MNKDKILKNLREFGLSDKESRLYLANLSLGSSTMQKIARLAGINRASAYHTAELLRGKNLLIIETRGLKQFYSAEDPKRINELLNEKLATLKETLPELAKLFQGETKIDSVKRYDGWSAIQKIYEKILEEVNVHDDYFVISDDERWFAVDEKYFQKFTEKRGKKNINTYLLLQDSPRAREHKKFAKNFHENIKLFGGEMGLQTNIVITPQRAVFHSMEKPMKALVVENPFVIASLQSVFRVLWQLSKDDDLPKF